MRSNIFICPDCGRSLSVTDRGVACKKCHRKFAVNNEIYNLLPKKICQSKINEDYVHTLKGEDNSWYNNRIWYYFIHLSSHVIRFEKEMLPKIRGPKVLELACGNGWASMLVKIKNPKTQVYATDISYHCLKIQAKQMSQITNSKPDYFIVCDAEKLPFEDCSFNTVFVVASLHHFTDISKALAEVKRVLKPRGSFYAFDGMMPRFAQKVLGDESSERTKKYGILERKISFSDWKNYLKEAEIPPQSLKLNYDSSYIHNYATNADEKKLIRSSWLFNVAKEIIYQAILSRIPEKYIIFFHLADIFPAGIVINYTK